jgi:hypothetical protein
MRASVDSLWKVGVKRGWWRAMYGGDILLFVLSLGLMNAIYEKKLEAVNSGVVRRGLSYLRGEGFRDALKEENGRVPMQGGEMENR